MFLSGGHKAKLPITFHEILNNIILEENEDVFEDLSLQSLNGGNSSEITAPKDGSIKKDFKITNEVVKLGLTANMDNDISGLGPFLIESRPKLKGRRHPGEQFDKHKSATLADTDEKNQHSQNIFQQKSERRHSIGKLERLEMKDIDKRRHQKRHIVDLAQSLIECKSKDTGHQTENSHQCNCSLSDNRSLSSSIDSVNSVDDVTSIFSEIECNIFRHNEYLERKSSKECLRQIQNCISFLADSDVHEQENFNLRRISSTSDIHSHSGFSAEMNHEEIEEVSKDDLALTNIKVTSEENALLHKLKREKSHRPRSKTVSVLTWAKSNKVRHSNRENIMFSPTSF